MGNQTLILIDVGTSTVKVYTLTAGKLSNVKNQTIFFNEEFTPEKGISETNFSKLCKLVNEIKRIYDSREIKIFATAIFRKFSDTTKSRFLEAFKTQTGILFTIISHDEESKLLEEAYLDKVPSENTMLINIGGDSTELIFMENKTAQERINLDIGVGTILKQFSTLAEEKTNTTLQEVINFALTKMPIVKNKQHTAFYTGGELKYMQLAKYPLQNNNLFNDLEHPQIISINDFTQRNKEIFQTPMSELKKMMPENSDWMIGSRACSGLAESICQHYGINLIIPSNVNLINGVAKRLNKVKE